MQKSKTAKAKSAQTKKNAATAAKQEIADTLVKENEVNAKKSAPKKKPNKAKTPVVPTEKEDGEAVVEIAPEISGSASPVLNRIGGKMIAVHGAPNSGKTSVALKLAQEIYFSAGKTVIYLSPDLATPAMGYIFPNGKDSDLHSVGVALDKTDIYREDVLKQLVNVKTMRNFGLLGYKLGENKYSYPRPTEDKVRELFGAAKEIADYVIVDCTCDKDDLISEMAYSTSDMAVQVITPNVKCMAYYTSNEAPFHTNKTIVMNICDNDLYLPIEEVKAHFKEVFCVLPYSRALKQQSITGTLSEKLGDRKYHAKMSSLARKVI